MPMATVLSLLGDLAGRRQGVPEAWRESIRARLPRDAVRVLAPVFGKAVSDIPHCLTPSVCVGDVDFDGHLHHIVTAAPERLLGEVETMYGSSMPAAWSSALKRPDRWISAYAHLMAVVWQAFSPVWRRAQPLLEREIVRVGTAAVRGAMDVVLSDLSPRWSYREQRLLIPDSRPGTFAVQGRRLVLTPTVSGIGASVFDPDLDDKVWLGYPVPGLSSLWRKRSRQDSEDPLSLVLGYARARLLLHADSRHCMTKLAEVLRCSPSVVTYHCDQLVGAGLLYRERSGRQAHVRRTERGEALMDLLGSG